MDQIKSVEAIITTAGSGERLCAIVKNDETVEVFPVELHQIEGAPAGSLWKDLCFTEYALARVEIKEGNVTSVELLMALELSGAEEDPLLSFHERILLSAARKIGYSQAWILSKFFRRKL